MLLAGGRGGGKSTSASLLVLRHVEKYKANARPLLIRETHKAVTELEDQLDALFHNAYGRGVKLNRADHLFRIPNGAQVELGQLAAPGDYKKYQGRSKTLLVVDEFGLLKDRRWVELLKSNLRSSANIPLRTILAANPGGSLHSHIHQSYIVKQAPWIPFELDGETWLHAPSTLADNPHIDKEDYIRKLRAACGNDEELLKSWLSGDWNIARGAYFGGTLDERIHQIRTEWPFKVTPAWRGYIAMDWGSSAPSIVYICLRAPGGVGPFPRNSLILVDELAVHEPNDLNVGLNWPPGKLAESIIDMCKTWGIQPQGVADDAYGLEDTLIHTLGRLGVHVQLPRKQRVAGWAKMRELLHNAKVRNGKPGMWISARCQYFWHTVPFIERDSTRPEDVITTGPDHAADAARYAVMALDNYARGGRTTGLY